MEGCCFATIACRQEEVSVNLSLHIVCVWLVHQDLPLGKPQRSIYLGIDKLCPYNYGHKTYILNTPSCGQYFANMKLVFQQLQVC